MATSFYVKIRVKRFALLLPFLVLTACAFQKEDEEAIRNKAIQELRNSIKDADAMVDKSEVTFRFDETETPHKYRLYLAWPKRVSRALLKIDGEEVALFVGQNYYVEYVKEYRKFDVGISFFNEVGGHIGSFSEKREPGRDVYIGEDLKLDNLREIKADRLFFAPNARIITHGHALTIDVKKIIFQDSLPQSDSAEEGGISQQISPRIQGGSFDIETAHILTTLPGTPSPTPEGKPLASHIAITANEAIGNMRVALIGFNGNSGRQPEPPAQRLSDRGTDGTAGETYDAGRYCVNDHGRPCPVSFECKVRPRPATNGKQGAPGGDGTDGQIGGDSGSLVITLAKHDQFSLSVIQMRGIGGEGGEGGLGGPGGDPGATPKPEHGCARPALAVAGPRGPSGNAGKDGKAGELGTIVSPKYDFVMEALSVAN